MYSKQDVLRVHQAEKAGQALISFTASLITTLCNHLFRRNLANSLRATISTYERVRLIVGPSVVPSVRPSVRPERRTASGLSVRTERSDRALD